MPYDFSVEYQRGKLNVVADVLSRMTNWLRERETNSYLQMVEGNTSVKPLIGDQNEQQSQDDADEFELPWPPPGPDSKKEVPQLGEVETLSPMQALFDGITIGASRCAKWEWDQSIIIDREEDDINLGVRAARLTIPMHIIDWGEARRKTRSLEPQSPG